MSSTGWLHLGVALLVLGGVPAAPAQQASRDTTQQDRPLKALSDQDILSYLNGEGMGLAKAAELNRFPGPRHVLDLAAQLGLTEPQKQRARRIFEAMHDRATELGREIVSREGVLDSLFSTRTIDSTHLRSLVSDIARLQGELRVTHLQAHMSVTAILAPDQIMTYERLRRGDAGQTHDEHAGHGG